MMKARIIMFLISVVGPSALCFSDVNFRPDSLIALSAIGCNIYYGNSEKTIEVPTNGNFGNPNSKILPLCVENAKNGIPEKIKNYCKSTINGKIKIQEFRKKGDAGKITSESIIGEQTIDCPTQTVYYGATSFVLDRKVDLKGSKCTKEKCVCDPKEFGGVPHPGFSRKACYTDERGTVLLAKHGDVFMLNSGNTIIYYGESSQALVNKVVSKYGFSCANSTFGSDPAPGVKKACYLDPKGKNKIGDEGTNLTAP